MKDRYSTGQNDDLCVAIFKRASRRIEKLKRKDITLWSCSFNIVYCNRYQVTKMVASHEQHFYVHLGEGKGYAERVRFVRFSKCRQLYG